MAVTHDPGAKRGVGARVARAASQRTRRLAPRPARRRPHAVHLPAPVRTALRLRRAARATGTSSGSSSPRHASSASCSMWAWGCYGRTWRHASIDEAVRLLAAGASTGLLLVLTFMWGSERVPLTVLVAGPILCHVPVRHDPLPAATVRLPTLVVRRYRRAGRGGRRRHERRGRIPRDATIADARPRARGRGRRRPRRCGIARSTACPSPDASTSSPRSSRSTTVHLILLAMPSAPAGRSSRSPTPPRPPASRSACCGSRRRGSTACRDCGR